MTALKLYIAGKWQNGSGDELLSINPATGDILAKGYSANAIQVEEAILAGKDAFTTWSRLTLAERAKYLQTTTEIFTKRQDELTTALAKETGKPIWEAKTEIAAMIGKFAITREAYTNRCQDVMKDMQGYFATTRHKPHGVVVVLGPFNFPGHLPNGHIMPALLAGNTIVFKPSELTSNFAVHMVQCFIEAGLPAGVLNLVLGTGVIGEALVANKDIAGVFFTGSYAVGRKIAEASLKFPNRIVALEMGGNSPLVVHKINDIKAAVYMTIQSAFTTAGQRCTCARRLIVVQDKEGLEFIDKLTQAIQNITIGAYSSKPEPFMGPLISENAANKVYAAYLELVEKGAKPLAAMQRLDKAFVTPALVDVTNITIADEEIFGPILQLIWVKDFNEAIAEANNTEYGLAAGLLCADKELYKEFLSKVHAGIINWNRPTVGSSSASPFGGLGKSGNFRPSAYYAADYCAYPVASMENATLSMPSTVNPGLKL